jgi:LacI family transcriptional regulator
MSKVTIEDISRHTGLSRGTVSRALNDRPDISVQTKERVLEACRQLKYVPSHAARALATGRRDAIAVVVDELRSAYAGQFLRGVLLRAREQRYAVHVAELGTDPGSVIDDLCMVANERVDSVVLGTALTGELARPIIEALDKRPLIAGNALDGSACDVLAPDYTEAGRLAARHLLRGGNTDILYVHTPGTPVADEQLAGFQEACREQNIDPNNVIIEIAETGTDRLAPLAERLATVRAIAASNDFLALQIMLACQAIGRTVGRDVAVMGIGNELAGTRITPTLTTVDLCGEEVGRRAAETAIQRVMKLRQDAVQSVRVPPMLIERETTRIL